MLRVPNEFAWMFVQRATGAVLGGCVLVHLATMIVAVRGGLSAAEIASRFGSSALWPAFYALFVICVAAHAPIGLRNVLVEHTRWRQGAVDAAALAFGGLLLATGALAVVAVWTLSRNIAA